MNFLFRLVEKENVSFNIEIVILDMRDNLFASILTVVKTVVLENFE